MITAYAVLKKSAATANHAGGRLDNTMHGLIVQVCDEILAGQHHDMFPLHSAMRSATIWNWVWPGFGPSLAASRSCRPPAGTSVNLLAETASLVILTVLLTASIAIGLAIPLALPLNGWHRKTS